VRRVSIADSERVGICDCQYLKEKSVPRGTFNCVTVIERIKADKNRAGDRGFARILEEQGTDRANARVGLGDP
jgi:hypothetical protein